MVSTDKGNLGSRVFFIWGSLCAVCFFYAYFLISETKGLTLEQVDKSKPTTFSHACVADRCIDILLVMEETTPRTSAGWKPHTTFAAEMGMTEKGTLAPEIIEHAEHPKASEA